jgi:hypothetical protein
MLETYVSLGNSNKFFSNDAVQIGYKLKAGKLDKDTLFVDSELQKN